MEISWPFPHGHRGILVTQAMAIEKEKELEEGEIAPVIGGAKAFFKILVTSAVSHLLEGSHMATSGKKRSWAHESLASQTQQQRKGEKAVKCKWGWPAWLSG